MNHQMIKWNRVKIDTEKLKDLRRRSDAKGLVRVLSYLIITIVLGAVSFYAFKNWSLWASLPIFFVYATVFSFSGYNAAIHELSHKTVFKSKWLNELFIVIFAFMSWTDYVYFRKSHTQHHAYTTFHGLDKEVVQPIDASIKRLLLKSFFDFEKFNKDGYDGVFGLFRRAFGVVKPEREAEFFSDKKSRRKLLWWDRSVLLGHLIIIILIVITKQWIFLLLFSFTIFFGQWLNHLVQVTQHAGLAANTPDFRQNCRSIKLDPITGFLYWNMHYHIEHHSYAAVPFYNLKKLRCEMKEYLPEAEGLFESWKEFRKACNKQKEDKEYFIKVDVVDL